MCVSFDSTTTDTIKRHKGTGGDENLWEGEIGIPFFSTMYPVVCYNIYCDSLSFYYDY